MNFKKLFSGSRHSNVCMISSENELVSEFDKRRPILKAPSGNTLHPSMCNNIKQDRKLSADIR